MAQQGVSIARVQRLCGFEGPKSAFHAACRSVGTAPCRTLTAYQVHRVRRHLLAMHDHVPPSLLTSRVIGIRMPKEGTGKTEIAYNIGATFARSGLRTLLIDADAQASLTTLCGVDWRDPALIHIGALVRRCAGSHAACPEQAVHTLYPEHMLDLIPADITLADERDLATRDRWDETLLQLFRREAAFLAGYDVVIVDCAPGTLMRSAAYMCAFDHLLAVVTPEPQAVAALDVLAANLAELEQALQHCVCLHIIVNRFQRGRAPHLVALQQLVDRYPNKVIDVVVREHVAFLRELDLYGGAAVEPAVAREPGSIAAQDIIALSYSLAQICDIRFAGQRVQLGDQ